MAKTQFNELFRVEKPVIGMIHLMALPGTPGFEGSVRQVIQTAITEALLYKTSGIDALMLENMHDLPYLKSPVGHEVTTVMSIAANEVKKATGLPCGVQVLAGANCEAMAVANAAGLDFIRAEGYVFAHVADEGLIDASAGPLLRYRRQIGADHIMVFSDIKKKHSAHSITADVNIAETAQAAAFFKSDGVIITGTSTGQAADLGELRSVNDKIDIPVIIGSGLTLENVGSFFELCDGMIVGSWFKKDGNWMNGVDENRVRAFMEKVVALRA